MAHLEDTWGLSLGAARIRTDADAQLRAQRLGARAWTDGQEIGFAAGAFDPGTVAGRLLLAHEYAHIGQRRGEPPAGGRADPSAEREARTAAELALDGRASRLSPQRFGLALEGPPAGGAAPDGTLEPPQGKPEAAGDTPKKPTYTLPPGMDWALQGYVAVVRVSWLRAHGWDGESGEGIAMPAVTQTLVRGAIRLLGWNWVTEEALTQQMPKMVYSIGDVGDAEVTAIGLTNLFSYFGPPDDMEAYWVPLGEGMLLVLRGESARAAPQGTTAQGVTTLKDTALNIRIVAQLEARTGMPIAAGPRAALLQLGIPVDPAALAAAGVMQEFPRALMDQLYGKEAWAAWLKNRSKDGKPDGKGAGGPTGGQPGGKTGGVAGGTNPAGKVEDVQRLRAIFDFLQQAHPDLVGDKRFEDFIAWLRAQQGADAPNKEEAPWPDVKDPEAWRTFATHFADNTQLPREMLSPRPSWPLRPDYVFKPNGELQLHPQLGDDRYPVGAEAELRMQMRAPPAENVLVNAYPRKADFHWSWTGTPAGLTGLGRGFGDPGGDQERTVKFAKPGVYVITAQVNSQYFRGGEILERTRTVSVVDPAQRLDELAEDQLATGYGAFQRDTEGKLKVRDALAGEAGEKAVGLEARERALADQIARIEALIKEGKIAKADGEQATDLIRDQLKKLGEFKKEAGSTGRPYVASAVFLSEDSGATFPLNFTMYGTVTRDGKQVSYQVLIADLSSLAAAPRYLDTVAATVAEGDAAGMATLEKRAVAAACEQFRKQNVYPDGRVRLFVRLHEDGAIHTQDFTTRSGRKTAKHAVGYAGMGLGAVALVGGVVFTEGTTTPIWVKVIAASAALAGVVEVGMNVEQRIQTGQFGDKLTVEAVDVVQVAASLVGLRALAAAKPVAGGFQVALKVGDVAQVAFLGASVKVQIDEAEAECTAQKAAGTDPKQAEAERDRKIATILQGAAMTGGFMLFSHALHGMSGGRGGPVEEGKGGVRQGIRETALNGSREEIAARLQQRGLNQAERTLLTHAYESAGKPKPPPRPEVPPPEAPSTEPQSRRAPVTPETPEPQAKPPTKPPVEPQSVAEPSSQKPAAQSPAAKPSAPVEVSPGEQPPTPRSPTEDGAGTGARGRPPTAPETEPPTLRPHQEAYPEGLAELELTRGQAYESFHKGIAEDASREVAIYVDSATNEHVVVQGGADFVAHDWMPEAGPGRRWRLLEHYHPGADMGARYASPEDFATMMHWQSIGIDVAAPVTTRVRWTDPHSKLQFVTEIGYTPGAERPYWIKYRDAQGKWQVATFTDTPWNAGSDYIRFLQGQGIPQPTIPKRPPPSGSSGGDGPAALPPAGTPTATPSMPAFNRAQQARLKDIRDALHTRDLSWESLGLHDEGDVARFFAGQMDLDAGIRALEARLRSRIALGSVHAQEQRPEGDTRGPATAQAELPRGRGAEVPEGQRLPRPTEVTDPEYGGFWGGARGDSEWFSDVRVLNEVTGWRPIRFRKGFPDLLPWAQERIRMPVTGNDATDFAHADRAMARQRGFASQTAYADWRRANRLTWHHVEGAEEMILVPRDLHENLPHVGGASDARSGAGPAP